MKRGISGVLAAAVVALISVGVAQAVDRPFKLKSPAFRDNAKLADKFAGNDKSNPNCVGENISPPLAWADPPEGTKS